MVHLLTSKEIDGNTNYHWQKEVYCTMENDIVKYRKIAKKQKQKCRYIVQLGPATHLGECNKDLFHYTKHKEQRWGLTQNPKKQYGQVTA